MPMLLMVENAVGLGLQTLGLGMLMVLGIIALLYIVLKIKYFQILTYVTKLGSKKNYLPYYLQEHQE